MTVLSVTNCGLGPEASETIANALIANENTKLTKLMISRSRVENHGALALATYFQSYDTLEWLEIFQNGIREEGALALVESLLPSAQSGNLKHLEINDNFFHKDDSVGALCTLIRTATQFDHLNIDSSNLDTMPHMRMLLQALEESESKSTLSHFSWSYDACDEDNLIKELLTLLGDRDQFPSLEKIELRETMAKKRNQFRSEFKDKDIKLVLSDRQMEEEEATDSEEEGSDSD